MSGPWTDGIARLEIETDPVNGRKRLIIDGHGFTANAATTGEIIAALAGERAPFPTRPEDYYRDQYDPRDFAKENR